MNLDIWILAGQSNMVGDGRPEAPEAPSAGVRVFGIDDRWHVARDPLHAAGARPRPAVVRQGLGMTFGKTLHALTGRAVGLMPCAKGSSCIDEWRPPSGSRAAGPLYAAMIRRARAAAATGGRIKGVLWYQGESDATTDRCGRYRRRLLELIAGVRRDLGDPRLPVHYVQIGRVLTFANDPNLRDHTVEAWNRVQIAQLSIEEAARYVGMVAAVDVELDNKIHVSAAALKVLGRRLALRVACDVYGVGRVKRGPRLAAVAHGCKGVDHFVDVTLRHANGALTAAGRPSGFSAFDRTGNAVPVIKTRITGRSTIRVYLHEYPSGGSLWYGHGADPVCNIEDAAGLALPVTGPVRLP